jgi:hypothetical protein
MAKKRSREADGLSEDASGSKMDADDSSDDDEVRRLIITTTK